MPTKRESRHYHHGNLRRTLLDTALEIVEKSGPGALSMRELGRQAGVSHTAAYRHFKSRQALLIALAEEGFRGLAEEMAELADPHLDPVQRLEQLGLAYVRYAVEHPGHFRVMFSAEVHEGGEDPELAAAGGPTLQQLIDGVVRAQESGSIDKGEVQSQVLAAWSIVHGLSMLIVDRQLAGLYKGHVEVDRLAGEVISVLLRSLARAGASGPRSPGARRRRS